MKQKREMVQQAEGYAGSDDHCFALGGFWFLLCFFYGTNEQIYKLLVYIFIRVENNRKEKRQLMEQSPEREETEYREPGARDHSWDPGKAYGCEARGSMFHSPNAEL